MTTHAAVLIQDWNSPWQVYYAKMDGYPFGLGVKLIRELAKYDNVQRISEPLKAEEEITKALGLNKCFRLERHEVEKVFTENFTDLEWVYTIDNFAHPPDVLGINIYKTSNLVAGPPFIWQVYDRILSYIELDKLEDLMEELERTGNATKNMLMAYVNSRPCFIP